MSLSAVTVGAFGLVPVVMVITFEAPLVPQVVVQVAVYVPAVVTVSVEPTAPVFQVTVPAQPVAVKVALAPLHKLVLLAEMLGAFGVLPVVIITEFDAPLVPQLLLQVAV
jgi:hypothetical protein